VRISILDLKAQYSTIKDEMEAVVCGLLSSGQYVLGEVVEKLEEEIAAYCGRKYGIGVASGTDALLIALRALGIGEGDGVITTPYTFFATAAAISRLNAVPIFVDIEPKTYNIDPLKIREFIATRCEFNSKTNRLTDRKTGRPIKAIVPVHLYGQLADMEPILKIARENNLKVIEDAAQAIGAECQGKRAGSFGDVGCFSFFPTKNLGGCGDAGMVVTNDKKIAERIRSLRVHGAERRYFHSVVGYNSRLDALQAAILRVKFKYLDGWNKARREHARIYDETFSQTEITTPYVAPNNTHIYHQYTIRLAKRDKLEEYLREKEIGCALYYPLSLHLQECYRELGYREGDLPEAEKASRETISLPVYPELSRQEQDYIIKTIKEFL
jgi:dTDP-4-amino-4,6-dideoxygalactose transaminase